MRKFQQLRVKGSHVYLLDLISRLKNTNAKTFVYQPKKTEEYAKGIFHDVAEVAVFKSPLKRYFESFVWLAVTDNRLWVANITSSINSNLGITNYNIVFNAFFADVIRPLLTPEDDVIITGENVSIRDLMSERSATALETWESWCDKSAPTSHPNDEERWFDFVCSIAEEEREFSPSDLEKWLSEDKEWPLGFREEIEELCLQYENEVRLLKYYLSHYGNR